MREHDTTTLTRSAGSSRRPWALILIGIGVLILVSNAGPFGSVLWSVTWPIALLAVGIDLITEGQQRRRIGIAALLGIIALAPLVGGARFVEAGRDNLRGLGQPQDVPVLTLSDIDRVRAEVTQSSGDLQIDALPDDSIDVANMGHDDEEFSRSYTAADRTGTLQIMPSAPLQSGDLDLKLTRRVPLDLTINLDAGDAGPLNFEDLQLEKLNLQMGAGDIEVRLPERGVMDVTIAGGLGSIELAVPDDLAARIVVDGGLGELDYDEDRFQEQDGALVSQGYSESAENRATIHISNAVGDIEIK